MRRIGKDLARSGKKDKGRRRPRKQPRPYIATNEASISDSVHKVLLGFFLPVKGTGGYVVQCSARDLK